jgi:hypothetical protein
MLSAPPLVSHEIKQASELEHLFASARAMQIVRSFAPLVINVGTSHRLEVAAVLVELAHPQMPTATRKTAIGLTSVVMSPPAARRLN